MVDDDKHVPVDAPVDELKDNIAKDSDESAELEDRWSALSGTAQELVVSDKGIRQLVGAMVASRQLYAMALHDLDYRLDSGRGSYKDIAEEDKSAIKEIFVSSAASQAANPFEESALLSGVRDPVIPWMEEVSAAHTAAAGLRGQVLHMPFIRSEAQLQCMPCGMPWHAVDPVAELGKISIYLTS